MAWRGAPHGLSCCWSKHRRRFSFLINPKKTMTYKLGGGNSTVFPAHALCDLSSAYGVDQWDALCVESTTSVPVNARAWLDAQGHAHVDFDQHLRFAPPPIRRVGSCSRCTR